jgi:hypothetical protein
MKPVNKNILRLAVSAITAVAIAGLVAAFAVGGAHAGRSSSVDDATPIALLDRAATSQDALPPAALSTGVASQLASTAAIRFAGTENGASLYLGPGTDDRICLIVYGVADAAGDFTDTIATCAKRSLLVNGAIFLQYVKPDGTADVYGAVADGRSGVSEGSKSASVINNVFALTGGTGNAFTVNVAGGGTETVQMGPERPGTAG